MLPFSVNEIPLELVFPLPVTEDRVELLAMVIVPEPLPVVVMSVPAAMVNVPPWEIVELDPEVEAAVKSEPPETTQVEQVKVTDPPKETDEPPPTGEVVFIVIDELVRAELGMLVKVLEEPDKEALVITPAEVMLNPPAEVMKLSKPVPKVMPLIVLLEAVVALLKFRPVKVFSPALELAVPFKVISIPLALTALAAVFELVAVPVKRAPVEESDSVEENPALKIWAAVKVFE